MNEPTEPFHQKKKESPAALLSPNFSFDLTGTTDQQNTMINSQLQIPTSSSLIHATSIGVAPLAVMNTATSSLAQNNNAAVKVKAVVTVKLTAGSVLSNLIGFTAPLDIITDLLGKTFLLELVSAELDPSKHNQYYLHVYKPYFRFIYIF